MADRNSLSVTGSLAVEAARAIRLYCGSRDSCDDCQFHHNADTGCELMSGEVPDQWTLPGERGWDD